MTAALTRIPTADTANTASSPDSGDFTPEPAPLAALTGRVRKGFDPQGVLNAGRMWAGV